MAGPPPRPPTASYVPSETTIPESTTIAPTPSSSKTESQLGLNTPIAPWLHPTTASYALIGTSEAATPSAPTAKTNTSTYAHSVGRRATTRSPGPAGPPLPTNCPVQTLCPPFLSYVDFTPSIITRPPLPHSSDEHSLIFDRITHPYNTDTFEISLRKHNLLFHYPLLPHNLRYGFPLGHMPPLMQTVIIVNNPSILPFLDEIDEYLHKEVSSSRMSGPFPREEVKLIMRGPFHSSPLIVSIQPQDPGTPDVHRICRHLSKSTKSCASVNSHICKDEFPTRFDTASIVAEIVSIRSIHFQFPPHFSPPFMPLCV